MSLGVFGGAFDPIHNGHLFVAEAVRETCALTRVLFVPTRHGHHRAAPLASVERRADMIRLAIAANTAFAFDDSDLLPESTGFTVDLLPRLAKRYAGEPLTFIVGGDSLVRSRWERLDEILDMLEAFVVAPRGDVTAAELEDALSHISPERRKKVHYLDSTPLVAESATLVHGRLAGRHTVRYLVPEPVFRYIEENELYR